MSTPSAPVAVTGATGQQGGATARALLERGIAVRALVRNPDADSARRLAVLGAEIATVDLADPASVEAALTGAASVFVMATMLGPDGLEGEIAVGTTVADAAVAAGVPFVVYSSVGGAERHSGVPHFESKRRIEEHIEGLDIAASFVRPVFFMDNFWSVLRPRVVGGEVVLAMPLPAATPLQLISVRDIGAATATLLTDPTAAPRAVEIVGDTRTGPELAAALGEVLGRPARYEALPTDVLDGDQRAMFEWFADTAAYRGDAVATRRLVPDILDFRAWLVESGLTPAED